MNSVKIKTTREYDWNSAWSFISNICYLCILKTVINAVYGFSSLTPSFCLRNMMLRCTPDIIKRENPLGNEEEKKTSLSVEEKSSIKKGQKRFS